MKKTLSMILVFCMVFSCSAALPASADTGSGDAAVSAGAAEDSSPDRHTAGKTAVGTGPQSSDSDSEEKDIPYIHDPRDNPEAMKDIVYNPDAVYCFSPSPDSVRLKEYADAIDWTDPEQVAQAREIREEYHESLSELYRMITDMLHKAEPVETIARAVSQRRNELRLEALKDNPVELERTKKSKLETYGHEEGPTPDELYEKYGSWQTVLEKALGTNAGMDACVGLYDEQYDYYDIREPA